MFLSQQATRYKFGKTFDDERLMKASDKLGSKKDGDQTKLFAN